MKEYIVRIQGGMMDVEPLEGETCSDVEELEAIMVAMIKSLNERLMQAERKIKELEARPVLLSEPLLPYERQILPDSPYGGWTITCNKI
jgi:hypothetical protein